MARDIEDSTHIESKAELLQWFEQGYKSEGDFKVGTEHEKFVYCIRTGKPVPYEGKHGIKQLLDGMHALLGWQPIMEGENIIGLYDVTGGGAISLEPGGQFELSGAPLKSIHDTSHEIILHLRQLKEIADPLGIGFFARGVCPQWRLEDMPQMPKGRYKIMKNYMPKVGTRGLDMMFRTTTVQANLDFSSEADMVKKLRLSLCLQPISTALFANSDTIDGQKTTFSSLRSEIWRDTDNNRAGMLPFVFEEGFGFEQYMDWVLNVPMYFVKRGATYHDVSGKSFIDFMEGKLEGFEGQKPTMADWSNHISTVFPEVRMKRYLEMRGADAGSFEMLCALPAFWVGLLYDKASLDEAYEMVMQYPYSEFQELRDKVAHDGLATTSSQINLLEMAKRSVGIAKDGLMRRNCKNCKGEDETIYLQPLEQILREGKLSQNSNSLLRDSA